MASWLQCLIGNREGDKFQFTEHRMTQFSSVQSLSRVRLFATPWITARQVSCPSPSPGVHPDSRPLSPWCHPAISSWVVPFSSCPQSLPASEFFPMSQLFSWGGQSTGVSGWHKVYEKKSNSEGQGKENVKEYLMRSPKRAEKCTCEISFLNFQLCPNTLILITLNFSSSL